MHLRHDCRLRGRRLQPRAGEARAGRGPGPGPGGRADSGGPRVRHQRIVGQPDRHRCRKPGGHRHRSAWQTAARDPRKPGSKVAVRGVERVAERRPGRRPENPAATRSKRRRHWRSRRRHLQGEADHPRRERSRAARYQRRRKPALRRQRGRGAGERRRRTLGHHCRDRQDRRGAGRRDDPAGWQGRLRDQRRRRRRVRDRHRHKQAAQEDPCGAAAAVDRVPARRVARLRLARKRRRAGPHRFRATQVHAPDPARGPGQHAETEADGHHRRSGRINGLCHDRVVRQPLPDRSENECRRRCDSRRTAPMGSRGAARRQDALHGKRTVE